MDQLAEWLAQLLPGFIVTMQLTLAAAVLNVIVGFLLAVGTISPAAGVRALAGIYVDVMRSIPLLAMLFFIFYGLGPITARFDVPSFWLAVVAIVLIESAYLAEVYRAGLLSIPASQWEAGRSLGLSWFATLRLVVLPQMLLPAVPSTLLMLAWLIKDTSLASLIAVPEVTLIATSIVAATFLPLQVYVVLAVLYASVILPLTAFAHALESRIRIPVEVPR
jgi:His/Glu/Gln/Arg/opine family amino acid ABC transporter permease subunit